MAENTKSNIFNNVCAALSFLLLAPQFLDQLWLSRWNPTILKIGLTIFFGIFLIKSSIWHCLKNYPKILKGIKSAIILLLVFVLFFLIYTPLFNGCNSSISCEIIEAMCQVEQEKIDIFKVRGELSFTEKEYPFPLSCIKTCIEFTNRGNLPCSIKRLRLVANMSLEKAQNILASDGYVEITDKTPLYNPIITVLPNETIRKKIYFFFPDLPNEENYLGDKKIYPQLNCFKIVHIDSANGTGESAIFGSKQYSLNFKGPGLAQSTWMSSPNEPSTPEENQRKIEAHNEDVRKNPGRYFKAEGNAPPQNDPNKKNETSTS